MRIAYILPSFQHPAMPGSARHYHFIRELSRRHRITLLSLCPRPAREEAWREMNRYCRPVLVFEAPAAADGHPSRIRNHLARRRSILEMRGALQALLGQESFDLVVFHGKFLYPVIADLRELPRVVDFCDATSARIRRHLLHASPAEWPRLVLRYLQIRRIERALLGSDAELSFITRRDRQAAGAPSSRGPVIPNGVDTEYWSFRREVPQKGHLVFTGVMSYPPNQDAAMWLMEKVVPRLRRRLGSFKLWIVGRDPSPRLLRKAARHPEVEVTGFVPDVRPYLRRSDLFLAPLRYASGMQNKILEAMAAGLPVITTPVAAEGVRPEAGMELPLLQATTVQEFVEGVEELLGNPALRARLAAEGRDLVSHYFNWKRGAEMFEELCRKAVARKEGGPAVLKLVS